MQKYYFQIPTIDRAKLSKMQIIANYSTTARFLRDTILEILIPNLDSIEIQPDWRKKIPLSALTITFSDSEAELVITAMHQVGFIDVRSFLRALAVEVAKRLTVCD